jgi:predicted transposase YbfD/YdcC
MHSQAVTNPRILNHFSQVTDPRVHRVKHRLIDIIIIVLLATLCGEEGWEGYFDWARDKTSYLKRFLLLENGIPCTDTLRQVFERLDSDAFPKAFIRWAEDVGGRAPGQICIDGKSLRKAASPLHIVSAWCESNRMVIGAVATESKGKEIPAIEELLDTLILAEGDIIMIDAIGCQTEIVKKIRKQKANYVIALKGNQSTLHGEAVNYFEQALKSPHLAACNAIAYRESRRGRDDIHEVWATNDLSWLPQQKDWPGLQSLIQIRRTWMSGKVQHKETRYYISSLKSTPEELACLVRRHWSIENEFHWHLDVTFREDENGISASANKRGFM